MKTAILVYEKCTTSMVFGVMDILSFANLQQQSLQQQPEAVLFDIEILSADGQPVKSFNNQLVSAVKSIKTKTRYDLIYVPGFLGEVEEVLLREVKLANWLKAQAVKGTIIAAACNGNFLLAESGVLNNKRATTHWNLIKEFRQRYQSVVLEPEKILVDEGSIISAAGVTAYQNLGIYLVYRFGSPELAAVCSKIFLVDSGRRIQTPYMLYTQPRKHGDRDILKVQEWLENNYAETISLNAIIGISHLGKRTLIRRFKTATGDTPLDYLQKIRIENAKRMLESTADTFSEITWRVGYEDSSSFQKLFKSQTGMSPREYRAKFTMV